ncbi:hypothetical protein [Burkholderia sp. HI2714]|uniref:hypothetical protein n=1 Tax=Burkholderia sp. HI2714 TaxID=2015359 RepID=UPI0011817628|nr:hypothetical protein [Burkholderia sp. HI2714]
MSIRRLPRPPIPTVAPRALLDAIGQRFGVEPFTFAQCVGQTRNPIELARLQDHLQAALRDGQIVPAVAAGGARGYRLAPDTWTAVQRRLARAAQQAAREAAEQREREHALEHAKIRDAIVLLERHGYRVIGPDGGGQSDG